MIKQFPLVGEVIFLDEGTENEKIVQVIAFFGAARVFKAKFRNGEEALIALQPCGDWFYLEDPEQRRLDEEEDRDY